MAYRSRLAAIQARNALKNWIIAGLVVFLVGAMYAWHKAGQTRPLHLPPDLSTGATVRIGEVPKQNAYAFAQYLLQALYYCEANCEEEFRKHIYGFRAYMTDGFFRDVLAQYKNRAKRNELYKRKRTLQPVPDALFNEDRVQKRGDAYVVWLDLRLQERVGGTLVKNEIVRYPVQVIPHDFSEQYNEWGLALGRYVKEPYRVGK